MTGASIVSTFKYKGNCTTFAGLAKGGVTSRPSTKFKWSNDKTSTAIDDHEGAQQARRATGRHPADDQDHQGSVRRNHEHRQGMGTSSQGRVHQHDPGSVLPHRNAGRRRSSKATFSIKRLIGAPPARWGPDRRQRSRPMSTQTMRAWRTHEYGERPTEVLRLDTVPIPDARRGRGARSRAGDPAQPERSRTHHRRQHDGAARAAVQPGHGGDGGRRRVRRRRRGVAGPARRRDAEGRQRRLRRVRDLSGRLRVRDARRRFRSPTRPRCTSRSTSRGSASSTAPSCRPARAC